jgi:hypothetical protein
LRFSNASAASASLGAARAVAPAAASRFCFISLSNGAEKTNPRAFFFLQSRLGHAQQTVVGADEGAVRRMRAKLKETDKWKSKKGNVVQGKMPETAHRPNCTTA